MEQTPIKLCEVCRQEGFRTQAEHFLSTIPVCIRHYQCVCPKCGRRWATEITGEKSDDGMAVFLACKQCNDAIKREEARRTAYNGHLSSEQWLKTKKALREQSRRENGREVCSRCRKTERDNKYEYGEGLHGHHTTYRRFGHEKTEDLELLCSRCHAWEHHLPLPKILKRW